MRRPLLAALLIACAFAAGCAKKNQSARDAGSNTAASATTATAPANGKKILHFGNGSEPQDLDPHTITGVPEYHLMLALYEGLVSEDPQMNIIPGVAERWEISSDGLVYTFHLRADAKWSNGDPITADDFVQTYQRILLPALGAEYAYMIFNHVAGAKDFYEGRQKDFSQVGIKALDSRTLRLTLNQPTPFLLHALNFYPWYPVHVATLKKFGAYDQRRNTAWTRPENFVGNGPFALREWRQNQKIVAARSPTYWDRASVKLDEIHFHPVELAETEERMFRTGQLDITNEVAPSKIPVYQRDNPNSIRIDPWCGSYFYRFNVKRKPFDDVRVRRALALAIDRETIVKHVTLGGELPAYSLVPPNTLGYTSRNTLKGDVAEAKRLLAEAGYPGGKGFPAVELLYNTLEKHKVIAEALQQMWRTNLGVEITLYNQEWKVYIEAQHSKNFQFQRAGWIADYVDPHVFLDMWETDGGNNDSNWSNAEYDRMLHSALAAKDNTERYEIYQRMEKILVDELPVLPIFFYTHPRLINPRVKHYYTTPVDNFPWKYVDLQ